MSNPIAGWYPDPSGDPSRLRYWDGGTWTEHFAEARPSAASAPESAGPAAGETQAGVGAAGYGAAPGYGDSGTYAGQAGGAGQNPAERPYVAGEGQGTPWQTPQQQASTAGYPGASYPGAEPSLVWAQDGAQNPYGPGAGAPGGAPDGQETGSQKGVVIGIVIGAVLLIAAVIVTAVVLLGGDDEDPEPVTRPTTTVSPDAPTGDAPETDAPTTPAGPAVPDGAVIEVGAPVSGFVPANGEWAATFTLAEESVVVVDARSTNDQDLTLQVLGSDGRELENDDRDDVFEDGGSNWRDPAIGAQLEPGEYTVVLTEYTESASDFTLSLDTVQLVSLGTVPVEIPAGGAWLAAIELPADGVYVFDAVSSDDADPVLSVVSLDGEEYSNDDSSEGAGSARDPYLRDLFAPGLYFVGMTEWSDAAATIQLTIAAE
ncbi:DUF2510 domain-containing protein [Georgenia sp. MJ206]|uniref:DUF2510 domain-containing protein n=1 Tax=Georgenia wangjunii TaxID=3117730 RepID=UPI002F266E4F